MTNPHPSPSQATDGMRSLERALFEVKKVVVGQEEMIEKVFAATLAGGHVLLEGVPGVAKTLALETIATVMGCEHSRLQFTPDLVPSDIVGTRIYRQSQESFDVELGPIVSNFVLADEINRAPAKVQSALLEVMAEGHVTIGGNTFDMPEPFLVMATQNPIENEGVYPLPEAQRDRFLMKLIVGYPTAVEEREIVYRMAGQAPQAQPILSGEEIIQLRNDAENVFIHHALIDYIVRIITATREPRTFGLDQLDGWLSYGASPRATLALVTTSRALALIRGRDFVVPQDIVDICHDVLRHRISLTYDAIAEDISVEDVITKILGSIPMPMSAPESPAPAVPPHAAAPHPPQHQPAGPAPRPQQ